MKFRLIAFIALASLVVVGPATHAEGQIRLFERGSWKQILKSHAGRPTMVNFWGVTCGPCKVELPLLGQFMKEGPALDLVMVSADLVPNLPEATSSMLGNAGLAGAESWIFNDGFAERLRYEIDPGWQGDIPRTMLISRDGTITTIEGVVDLAEVRKWLAQQSALSR
jgi:thiol-disulfide isomerase/thioredoxin